MSTIYNFVQCHYSSFDRFTLEGTDLVDKQKIPSQTVETVWTKQQWIHLSQFT